MSVLFDSLKLLKTSSVRDDANKDTKDEEKREDDDQVALEKQKYSFLLSLFTKDRLHRTDINFCSNVYQTCPS